MVGQSLMVDYVIMEFEFKDQRLKSVKVSLNYSKWFKKNSLLTFTLKTITFINPIMLYLSII